MVNLFANINGVVLWQTTEELGTTLQVQSDAAGSLGFGIYFNIRWCTQRWPAEWRETGILRYLTFLEPFLIVVAVTIRWHEFQNSWVRF